MKTSHALTTLGLVIALGAGTLAVSAASNRTSVQAPADSVLEIPAIYGSVTASGFNRISEIELENGVYEVKASRADGIPVKLKIDAFTGEVIDSKIKQKKANRDYQPQSNTRL